tara:strand:- start:4226 stop:5692 length:1467 start_codon:yes stop_codon:yes gene_type:complete
MNDKKISFLLATTPIILLVILLILNVVLYGDNTLGGSNQMALLLSGALAVIIGIYYKVKWKRIIEGISESIKSIIPAMIMLLLIGSLSGTWLISGIIPTMIYYGLKILNPDIFLFATAIITAIISVSTGSSWSTIATVGLALLSIGTAIGLPVGIICGAIISGAYFGDKMSPLSETTNMASGLTGVDLFKHIKHMMYTTIPSFIITIILFLFIGFYYKTDISDEQINLALNLISNNFVITPWLFIIPIIVIYIIIKRTPAIPALFLGTLLGAFAAIILQTDIVIQVSGLTENTFMAQYKGVLNAMVGDVNFSSINDQINNIFKINEANRSNLLKSSGMLGMMNTILLMICAMIFSGSIQATGILKSIADPITAYAKTEGGLIATTASSCIFFNITTSDQYMSIVVPSRMFAKSYKDKGLSPENLSRTLEDSGTMTSVLIPWNSCGATQSAVLGVATISYLPFCFFNLISPIMTITYGYLSIKINRLNK